jgi:hypothetical protein
MSKHPPPKPWEARIPGTPPVSRMRGTTPQIAREHKEALYSELYGLSGIATIWFDKLQHGNTNNSEPTLAAQGINTLWDRYATNAVSNAINNTFKLPTPNPPTNQDDIMPYNATHFAHFAREQACMQERAAKGFVHPSQHSLRTWATSTVIPVIEMPLSGVAWHSPKTQEPGGSHSTPGLTLRSTRVRDDLFFAIADGVDSPVQVQFRIPMAALVTMLVRYQSLNDKPAGYMMYLTENGELRFPTSDDETIAGGPAPTHDSNKE